MTEILNFNQKSGPKGVQLFVCNKCTAFYMDGSVALRSFWLERYIHAVGIDHHKLSKWFSFFNIFLESGERDNVDELPVYRSFSLKLKTIHKCSLPL